ncbi:MAG: metal ABC transporter permease [Bacteroidetes bacterium]|nr:metal ABC transporter permease [Bacteroidota bacterium]
MESLLALFHYQFFINAIVAAVLTSISCGIIGTYIVTRRMVFISGGITHTSFGGIGLGYFLGINPMLGAAIFSVFSALGIEYLVRKVRVREDSMIAIFWSFGMAVGIIFIFLTPGYVPNLMSYLFGSILTVSYTDIFLLLLLNAILILFFIFFYHTILYIAFDEEFARTRRVPVDLIKYILMGLIALTIVFNIRVAGIILIISLLTIPQTVANMLSNRYKMIMVLSVIIGFAGAFAGLIISYFLNIPSGATIIFSLVIIFIIIRLFRLIQIRSDIRKTNK